MRVTPIAQTCVDWKALEPIISGTRFADAYDEPEVEDSDHLAEFAGRTCYLAYNRENEKTATTAGYLANIIDQGHFSVLEHASVTFHVTDVSRALLTELERHRFLSFSVESQRYVNTAIAHPAPVPPPAMMEGPPAIWMDLQEHYARSLDLYTRAAMTLEASGLPRKKAREAARAFLPNATPVNLIVTGNLRAWRDVLAKRYHEAADAEIREFAAEILRHLRTIAPLSVQDFPNQPIAAARH